MFAYLKDTHRMVERILLSLRLTESGIRFIQRIRMSLKRRSCSGFYTSGGIRE